MQRRRRRRNSGGGDSEPSGERYAVVEKREEALRVAKRWKKEKGKIWTNRSRLDDGTVGAAAVWLEEAHIPPPWTAVRAGNTYHSSRRRQTGRVSSTTSVETRRFPRYQVPELPQSPHCRPAPLPPPTPKPCRHRPPRPAPQVCAPQSRPNLLGGTSTRQWPQSHHTKRLDYGPTKKVAKPTQDKPVPVPAKNPATEHRRLPSPETME